MADVLQGVAQALGTSLTISQATIETTVTPPFTYTPNAAGQAPSAGGLFAGLDPLSLLKPKLTVYLAGGGAPIVVAPYGLPSSNFLPYFGAALAAAVAAFGYTIGPKMIAKPALIAAAALAAFGYLNNNSQASQ